MFVVSGFHIDNITIQYICLLQDLISAMNGCWTGCNSNKKLYAFSQRCRRKRGRVRNREAKRPPFFRALAPLPFNACCAGNSLFETCKVLLPFVSLSCLLTVSSCSQMVAVLHFELQSVNPGVIYRPLCMKQQKSVLIISSFICCIFMAIVLFSTGGHCWSYRSW